MKIIRPTEFVEGVNYEMEFPILSCPGRSYVFACDETGVVNTAALRCDAARVNYKTISETGFTPFGEKCGPGKLRRHEFSYRIPPAGQCDCGAEVELDSFTNTCDNCGADYNSSGTRLAPREQWGEETGERWFEVY